MSPATLRDHFQRLEVRELDPVGLPNEERAVLRLLERWLAPRRRRRKAKGRVMFPQLEQVVRRTSLIDWNLSEPLALEAAGD